MKIYITGAAGTGKTSIARELATRGIPALDMDHVCHWEHRDTGEETVWEPGKSDEWYQDHGWICNIGALKEFLATNENAVVVGLSSNQEEYLPLFDKVLVLHSSPETIIERLNARTHSNYGKHPNEQQRLLNWHRSFEKEMVEKGAIPLSTEHPVEETVEGILKYF